MKNELYIVMSMQKIIFQACSVTASKADIYQKKVMLRVWWDYEKIVRFELLPPTITFHLNVYCL